MILNLFGNTCQTLLFLFERIYTSVNIKQINWQPQLISIINSSKEQYFKIQWNSASKAKSRLLESVHSKSIPFDWSQSSIIRVLTSAQRDSEQTIAKIQSTDKGILFLGTIVPAGIGRVAERLPCNSMLVLFVMKLSLKFYPRYLWLC